jgi:acyl-CoA synthetase (AMP-forming)/AMP-acid ligase II/acyl carrier protein
MKQRLQTVGQENESLHEADGGMRLYYVLKARAELDPGRVALLAPGLPPLTYGGLIDQIDAVISALKALGVERNDRIPIVLPNGPEMAVAFLAVACIATSAPLNPAYRAGEFEFYLSDLKARALLVQAEIDSPARKVAQGLGVPIIEASPMREMGAGSFALSASGSPRVTDSDVAGPTDIALALHTSGTTSRPKLVPLTHGNICSSARNIRTTLRLIPDDCCLNVMPLFHVHGLIGALLSSLTAGASIICTPGFYAPEFFKWLEEFYPTWYTAVPTMHQSILDRTEQNREIIKRSRLRFIRSSSSALPPTVMLGLEREFGVPVIEAYGMTEASHQVASNPLPPARRKTSSVGMETGPEVAIIDDAGVSLPPLSTGQIVIRGNTVLSAYEKNPSANESSFSAGWFKTGDQGYMDDEGFVFITGRLKELINRGGEKIAPFEIDKALLDHPAVGHAVAFAMPDARLGEAVAAAVVLREGSMASELEILEFVGGRLADFKVPSKLVILDEIPKGPTGKVQRVGLAEKLGLKTDQTPGEATDSTPARTLVEEMVADIWSELLGVQKVGIHDDFLRVGGDSVIATRLVARLLQTFDIEIPVFSVFSTPTVAGLSEQIEKLVALRSLDYLEQADPV